MEEHDILGCHFHQASAALDRGTQMAPGPGRATHNVGRTPHLIPHALWDATARRTSQEQTHLLDAGHPSDTCPGPAHAWYRHLEFQKRFEHHLVHRQSGIAAVGPCREEMQHCVGAWSKVAGVRLRTHFPVSDRGEIFSCSSTLQINAADPGQVCHMTSPSKPWTWIPSTTVGSNT